MTFSRGTTPTSLALRVPEWDYCNSVLACMPLLSPLSVDRGTDNGIDNGVAGRLRIMFAS